ncbi:MAG: T9SS type A sorting domain-containing protein [Bacteroidetes bacterium]|nr:T9SS type A sorting domain-containing protein [Bacteroidota bacterium]
MKTSLVIISIFLSITACAQGMWLQRADAPSPRQGAIGFGIDSFGYAGLGIYHADSNDLWQYDPVSNSWARKASYPGLGRGGCTSLVIGSKAYVGLGYISASSQSYRDFWEYDPDLDSWTRKADFPGTRRFAAVNFSLNGKGYIGLGSIDTNIKVADLWEYDPMLDTWTQKADFPGQYRLEGTSFSLNGKGYLVAGMNPPIMERDVWEYDPSNDSWNRKNDFPSADTVRLDAVGFTIGSTAYISCGLSSHNGVYNDLWEYDNIHDTWIARDTLPAIGRGGPISFTIHGRAYVGLGTTAVGNGYTADLWEYVPDTTHTGISEIPGASSLIFPNPASEKLYLNREVLGASIIDISGRSYEVPCTNREVDLSGLSAGVYVLKVQNGKVYRFVKD